MIEAGQDADHDARAGRRQPARVAAADGVGNERQRGDGGEDADRSAGRAEEHGQEGRRQANLRGAGRSGDERVVGDDDRPRDHAAELQRAAERHRSGAKGHEIEQRILHESMRGDDVAIRLLAAQHLRRGNDVLLVFEQVGARHPLGGELAGGAQVGIRGKRVDDVEKRRAHAGARWDTIADERTKQKRRDDREGQRSPRQVPDVIGVETRLHRQAERCQRETHCRGEARTADRNDGQPDSEHNRGGQ